MTRRQPAQNTGGWPAWWRWTVIAVSTLILCSCRHPHHFGLPHAAAEPPDNTFPIPNPEFQIPSAPLPYQVMGELAPPGIARAWPADEYLEDGGDTGLEVRVTDENQVAGLDIEDTVAQYDTLDGRTRFTPSNRVCVYAPRFGAVRVVSRIVQNEQRAAPIHAFAETPPVRLDKVESAATRLQRIQPGAETGNKLAIAYRTRVQDGVVSSKLTPAGFQDAYLPFENLSIIRVGVYDAAERARLLEGITAAITWSYDQAVQVILDHQAALEVAKDEEAGEIYTVEDRRPAGKLRIIKVASTEVAQPGDVIDFTLRYDNVGGQPIDNVVILDSLSTRLEYVLESAQSSLPADFTTATNEGDSLVLRWEIGRALAPGDGGVLRFRSRVR